MKSALSQFANLQYPRLRQIKLNDRQQHQALSDDNNNSSISKSSSTARLDNNCSTSTTTSSSRNNIANMLSTFLSLKNAPRLSTVSFGGGIGVSDNILRALEYLSCLEELKLDNANNNKLTSRGLLRFVERAASRRVLKYLELDHIHALNDTVLNAIGNYLPRLKELNMPSATHVGMKSGLDPFLERAPIILSRTLESLTIDCAKEDGTRSHNEVHVILDKLSKKLKKFRYSLATDFITFQPPVDEYDWRCCS